MLPRSSWTPDSAVERCQHSDCTATFPVVSARASENGDLPTNATASTAAAHFLSGLTSIISHPFQSRRHHCRACGRIFCGTHSSNTLPLSTASAVSSDASQLAPPPTTPGFMSPVGGGFPFTPFRKPSSSGTATPVSQIDAHVNPTISSPSQDTDSTPAIVQARVCDDCHVSLQLAYDLSSLTGLNTFAGISPPSLSSSITSKSQLPSRPHSPLHTEGLSRPRISGGHSPHNVVPVHSSIASLGSVSSRNNQEKPKSPHPAGQEKYTASGQEKAVRRHPLDPRYTRLGQIVNEDNSSGGSNPDGSLAASLGTTPAAGWTWST